MSEPAICVKCQHVTTGHTVNAFGYRCTHTTRSEINDFVTGDVTTLDCYIKNPDGKCQDYEPKGIALNT